MSEYRAAKEWPYHVSCGGVVYREKDRKYLLLFRGERFGRYGNTWHLPKGTLSSEETMENCALREIKEESGCEVEIIGYLGTIHDAWHSDEEDKDVDKTTHYFLASLLTESDKMDDEHDQVQWLRADEAREKLKLMPKNEAEIIDRAERFFNRKVYGDGSQKSLARIF